MPIEVLMPALSPTMTEGNLAKWHKKEGDKVKAGDVLAEIETDKATMEVEAVDEGTLGRILVPEGTQGVKVNAPIAMILGEDEDPKALGAKPAASSPSPPRGEGRGEGAAAKPAPAPAPAAPPHPPVAAQRVPPSPRGGEGQDGGARQQEAQQNGRLFVSPLARRMAEQA